MLFQTRPPKCRLHSPSPSLGNYQGSAKCPRSGDAITKNVTQASTFLMCSFPFLFLCSISPVLLIRTGFEGEHENLGKIIY